MNLRQVATTLLASLGKGVPCERARTRKTAIREHLNQHCLAIKRFRPSRIAL